MIDQLKKITNQLKQNTLETEYRALNNSYDLNLKPSAALLSDALSTLENNNKKTIQVDVDQFTSKLNTELLKSGVELTKESYTATRTKINDYFNGIYSKYGGAVDDSVLVSQSHMLNTLDNTFIKQESQRSVDLSKRVLDGVQFNSLEYEDVLKKDIGKESVATLTKYLGEEATYNFLKSQKQIAFKNSLFDLNIPIQRLLNDGKALGFTPDQLLKARSGRESYLKDISTVKTVDLDELNSKNPDALDVTLDVDKLSEKNGVFDLQAGYTKYIDKIRSDPTLSEDEKAVKEAQARSYYNLSVEKLRTNRLDYGIARKDFTPSGFTTYSPQNKYLSRIEAVKESEKYSGIDRQLDVFTSSELARVRAGDVDMVPFIKGLYANLRYDNPSDTRFYEALNQNLIDNNPRLHFLATMDVSAEQTKFVDGELQKNFQGIDVSGLSDKMIASHVSFNLLNSGEPVNQSSNPLFRPILDRPRDAGIRYLYNRDPMFKAAVQESLKQYLVTHMSGINNIQDFKPPLNEVLQIMGVDVIGNNKFNGGYLWGTRQTLSSHLSKPIDIVPKVQSWLSLKKYTQYFDTYKYKQVDLTTAKVVDEDGNTVLNSVSGKPLYVNLLTGESRK